MKIHHPYFTGYQRQAEDPSVPYTPLKFWNTMQWIDNVKVTEGRKPELKRVTDDVHFDVSWQDPLFYHAKFYLKSYDVMIVYKWSSPEATITLLGNKEKSIRKVVEIISIEHRCANCSLEQLPPHIRGHARRHHKKVNKMPTLEAKIH